MWKNDGESEHFRETLNDQWHWGRDRRKMHDVYYTIFYSRLGVDNLEYSKDNQKEGRTTFLPCYLLSVLRFSREKCKPCQLFRLSGTFSFVQFLFSSRQITLEISTFFSPRCLASSIMDHFLLDPLRRLTSILVHVTSLTRHKWFAY